MKETDIGRKVLITGGTGFLGKAVLSRIAEMAEFSKIYLLVRPSRGLSAEERVAKMIERMFPPGKVDFLKSKIIAVAGNLTEKQLGLTEDDIEGLSGQIDQILHVGASTDFGAPLDVSRLNNVEGTRQALELGIRLKKAVKSFRFDYVSTAFVAGVKPGRVKETELARGQKFANNYEQSKWEAEVLVESYRDKLELVVYRPSIVVGDSNNGYTPHFKVLYWPLMLLSKNLLSFFACNPRAHLDVVPVNYVADGLVALMLRPESKGQTFYLTAGTGNEIRVAGFLRDAYQHAGIRRVPVIPIWMFRLVRNSPLRKFFAETFWEAVELADPYTQYLRGTGVRFNNQKSQELLSQYDIKPPVWNDYKREILNYCRASRWGKKLPMPEYIYYLPVSNRKETRSEFANREQKQRIPAPV